MKRLFNWWRRYLMVAALIVGVALALPMAHTASLHAPHANSGVGAVDRHCSLATCGAVSLVGMPVLFTLATLVLSLTELRIVLARKNPLTLDPPPRFAHA
ncbi:MAG TPA: hypothetical protein VIK33_15440 [Anaerolineae bacterium]